MSTTPPKPPKAPKPPKNAEPVAAVPTETVPAPDVANATPEPTQPPVDATPAPVEPTPPKPPKALPETVQRDGVTLKLTKVGLPNTCTETATPCTTDVGWYAEHDDAAKSGVGYAPSTVAGYFED